MRLPFLALAPPLSLGVHARRPVPELPFPLGEPGTVLFARGRHALWQGVQALELRPGDGVLAPAYHHGAEIEALLRAGLAVSFYDAGPMLEPDPAELESLLAPHVRALYLTHHLGFPQDAPRWRSWCDERGLLLLEDAAQAWLATHEGSPVGSSGDLAIFCVYDTVAVPDGGALRVRAPAPRPETTAPTGAGSVAARHAAWAVQGWGLFAAARRWSTNGPLDPAAEFALGDPGSAPTRATLYLLPRVVNDQVALKRRSNYEVLLGALRAVAPAPFATLTPGAVPFAFPIESDDPGRLVARLAERGIGGAEFWRVPHPTLPAGRFPGAAALRRRTVLVPVHQELDLFDLERIAAAVTRPRRRPTADLRLEPLESFEGVRDAWDELAERSGNVFATLEWLSRWWRHFGRDKRLLLTGCRDKRGELVAILPLYLGTRGRLRLLRLLGHGTADQLGPVCAPEDRGRAARALRRLLDERLVGWDIFVAELLPGDQPWTSLLGARPLARDGSPVLRFEHDTWLDYLASRSRGIRKELGRTERRLREAHEVEIRLCDDADRLAEDLDTLFMLHRSRWSDDESPFGANEAFHRDLAEAAFRRGWLYLWLAFIDGEPAAAEYALRFAGAQNHFQGGRHPAFDQFGIGKILFAYSVRAAFEDGLKECRFLRGREEYKYRFATEDPELETVGIARGSFGDAALAATLALRRWHHVDRLRRLLAE